MLNTLRRQQPRRATEVRRQLLGEDGRLHVAIRPYSAEQLDHPGGTDILRVHLIHHATDGAAPGGDPHQVFRAQAGFNIVRRRAADGVFNLSVGGVLPHVHHDGLADAVLLFQRLFQRDKNVGGLDDGNFYQPLFLAARQRPRHKRLREVQQRGNLGLLFILAVIQCGDLDQ